MSVYLPRVLNTRIHGLALEEFRREFEYLVAHEPPPLDLDLEQGFILDTVSGIGDRMQSSA